MGEAEGSPGDFAMGAIYIEMIWTETAACICKARQGSLGGAPIINARGASAIITAERSGVWVVPVENRFRLARTA